MKIYLLLDSDNIVYGYHTQPIQMDNVVEYEIEMEQQQYIQDNVGYLKFVDDKLVEIPNPNFDKQIRLAEIKARIESLDIMTYKFIDGELTDKQYEPFKLEKIELRKEYRTLEEELDNKEV